MTPATAASTKTEDGQADLHAQAIRTGTAVIQDAAKLIQSLEGADPETVKRVNALLTAGLAGVRGEASPEVPSLESRKAALIKEFGIEVVGEGKVWLTLGETSRIDFLRKVQEVATELHGRPAIYSSRLESWATEAAFTAKPKKGEEIGVDGNVANSTRNTRAEQDAEGWNNVDLSDLAVAHAAYFLATGKDLFAGNVVRARGGALYFHERGLSVFDYGVLHRHYDVAASTALPPRN